MVPVLEAVPNFSQGRDPAFLDRLVRAVEETGAEVLDRTSDPDHHRSVVTLVGSPRAVEEAAVACARIAVGEIDLRGHSGVHPRIGALDVLPFVPLWGLTLEEARLTAARVGRRLASEVGVPVYFYASSSDPPGRPLSELRRGGFEALRGPLPPNRLPDLLPPGYDTPRLHPTAGAVCVGARPPLLAWNADVEGLSWDELRVLAGELRETGGGFDGLRVLALALQRQERIQISMNLEDIPRRDPWAVFQALERSVEERGGRLVRTEIVGLCPDRLLQAAAADRLRVPTPPFPETISSGLVAHLSRRASSAASRVLEALRATEEPVPDRLKVEVEGLVGELITETAAGMTE
jgi:glutamate formiminotransferase